MHIDTELKEYTEVFPVGNWEPSEEELNELVIAKSNNISKLERLQADLREAGYKEREEHA